MKLPDLSKLPDVKLPDVKFPEVKLPDVKLPEVKLPDVPQPKELLAAATENAVSRVSEDYARDIERQYSARELDPERPHEGCALVLEGGGMRGIFTAGVLDVLREAQLMDYQSVWGVSAGAINAVNVKSKQLGRAMRVMLAFRDDKRFMSYASLVQTGNIAGAEFMYEEVNNVIDPVDTVAFAQNPMKMVAVATRVRFGSAAYFVVDQMPDDVVYVQASASLPGFSKLVMIDDEPYLDGGTADSIPFATALGLKGSAQVDGVVPAQKAVVVLTQARTYTKVPTNDVIASFAHNYDEYPDFLRALYTRADRYNAQRQQLFDMEAQGDVFIIEPPEALGLKTTEKDGEALLRAYLKGRQAAEQRLDDLRVFLAL